MIRHFIYWLGIMVALTFYFAYESDWNYAVYFVSFLTPVAVGTTYFFNYYLVPNYLLKGKHFLFGLYFLYTLIISFYLEMVVMILSLILIANYRIEDMSPRSGNIVHLSIIIYLIVFFTAFLKLIKQLQQHNLSISVLKDDNQKLQKPFINVRVDRKDFNLSLDDTKYIESLADFIKIHTIDNQVVTKEKISSLYDRLPPNFIRIHRSFIVNKHFIKSFNKEKIALEGIQDELPISRTYKKEVAENLKS